MFELSRQKLEKVIYELELQQNISDKVDLCVIKINETNERCVQLAKSVEENQTDFLGRIEAVINAINQLEKELNETNEKRERLSEQVNGYHKDFLKRLEKKSFFDSIVYKIFVGVVALCALILSLVSF